MTAEAQTELPAAFGSDDDHVYALSAATGAQLWSFPTGSAVESSPAVANDRHPNYILAAYMASGT